MSMSKRLHGFAQRVCFMFLTLAVLPASASAKRVALIFGNGSYAIGALPHPTGDAVAIGKVFRILGFESVSVVLNADKAQMEAALGKVARDCHDADVAVVYFAGHGAERDGRNYLVPVDAKLERVTELDLQAVAVSVVLDQIANASKLKLVILDAARPNAFPLAGNRRLVTRGLARMEPEDNTLVVFSTRVGELSHDSAEREHSNLTAALLKHLPTSGLEVRMMLAQVRDEVVITSDRAQTPHLYGSLGRERHYLSGVALSSGQSSSRDDLKVLEQLAVEREQLEHEVGVAAKASAEIEKQARKKNEDYKRAMKIDPKLAFGLSATFAECVLGCRKTTTRHARKSFPEAYSTEGDKAYLDRNCRGICKLDANHDWNY
jgi:Caspase domain